MLWKKPKSTTINDTEHEKQPNTVVNTATTKTTTNIKAQNPPKVANMEAEIQKVKKKKAKKDKTAGLSFTLMKPTASESQQNPAQLKLVASKPSKNLSQSASQKRNGLLQLANALKSKTKQNSSNKMQDRLQKMFK